MRTTIGRRLLTLLPKAAVARFRRRSSRRGDSYSRNRWGSAADKLGFGGIEASLHEAAIRATGYDDFGDVTYRTGLGRLLEAIESSPYTPLQRKRIRAGIVPVLAGRLYSERGWRESPDCLNIPIRSPLIICGLPRSGTTALHKLVSMDHRFQGLNGWLVTYPMPRPPTGQWQSMREYRLVAEGLKTAFSGSPTQRAAHFRTADEVDECLGLMSQTFVTNLFPAGFHLPTYDKWFRSQDQRPTYRRLANNLRLIGSNQPDKPWLLKNPGHILALDALIDVFPDARVVQTHRHPGPAMASISSLLAAVRKSLVGADVSTEDIAGREVSLWSQAVKDAMAARETRPHNFHDVDYEAFISNPMAVVRAVYDHFGIELNQATVSAMEDWLAANPQGKHGAHIYDMESFGLSHALIEQEFVEYIRRFGLACQPE